MDNNLQVSTMLLPILSERGDSNARPLRPERSALPTALLSDNGRAVALPCLYVKRMIGVDYNSSF